MKNLLRLIKMSAVMIAAVAFLSLFYALYMHGVLSPAYVFTANFYVGVLLTVAGLLTLVMGPVFQFFKRDNLLDHSTFSERYMEEREKARIRSYDLLYLGMLNITLTAVIQLILSFII
ncbi:MAG: hypothetical protein FWE20_05365 [Defluviitaleaceae bacterium]|nr:hypothetical protein [Defluviitaleaceae bacterium]